MTTRRRLIAGVMMFALIGVRSAQSAIDKSAEQFLDRIYAHYTGRKGTDGLSLESPAAVRQLFDPPLAALVLADAAHSAQHDEPPALDGDPFVDAQDWLIRDVRIAVTPVDAQHATATVDFTNFEKPKQVRLQLVRLPVGWRIHDITYAQGVLSQLLTTPD